MGKRFLGLLAFCASLLVLGTVGLQEVHSAVGSEGDGLPIVAVVDLKVTGEAERKTSDVLTARLQTRGGRK